MVVVLLRDYFTFCELRVTACLLTTLGTAEDRNWGGHLRMQWALREDV